VRSAATPQTLGIGLKNALRQAPDVIMIGEIRDRETMSASIAYAQSGHLCMATMHANNSYQALNRILSFYPAEVRPTMLQRPGLGPQGRRLAAPAAHRAQHRVPLPWK
jgi:Tfp pilus assembly ATPase PilU